jgi:exodeoxyribonuclease V beta subunit
MDATGTSQPTRPFDLTGPLPQGVTVLEASAGTGKTYTLAALATRFIAERAVPLEQLLIVTFTRAATSELRERVRERLVLTEQALARAAAAGAGAEADPGADPDPGAEAVDEVAAKLAQAPAPILAQRLQRLAGAIANFDAITIETTHGFCQNVLDGLGTLADSDPAATFTDSLEELTREVVDDLYLRRFARQAESVLIGYEQAQTVASAAIANPLEPLYPLAADDGSAAALRRRLAQAVRSELEARKRSQGLMTHDDQLTRLLETLNGAHGEAAVASLQARFRVVLIDEFQDTDPTQWAIVNRAFAHQTTLVLIGDPKQAIYAFRGADVHAYLAAARSAGVRATLAVNHRSDQLLLDGLDALFGNARLGHPEIVYRRVRATAANAVPRLQGAPGDGALQIRLLEAGETSVRRTAKTGFPESSSARAYIARDLAAEAHRLLGSGAHVLTRERAGSAGAARVPLKPGDVAVLVRTHQQARTVKETLEQVGLPAVINGSGSVFGTPAAQDWLLLLRALEDPSQPARARTAALSAPIGWSATELALADEPTLEQLHRLLHGWAQTLREHGVTALVRAVLHRQDLAQRLLSVTGGERHLTDLEHIGQLLAADASMQPAGVTSLAGWLRTRIGAADREGTGDERTRRLDSDADAIQVLTFHRSKGLEFPIVFCPFLWEPGRLAKDGEPVYFHADDGRRALDVGLEGREYQAHLRRHNLEERDEELRLAYVALTRARHRAVVWWASGRRATRPLAVCCSPVIRTATSRRRARGARVSRTPAHASSSSWRAHPTQSASLPPATSGHRRQPWPSVRRDTRIRPHSSARRSRARSTPPGGAPPTAR